MSAIQSTPPAASVGLGNQECTPCTLTPTKQAFLHSMLDLMPIASEVNPLQWEEGIALSAYIVISFLLILTADPLLIANETGLNITDIQEALLNLTFISALKPGK